MVDSEASERQKHRSSCGEAFLSKPGSTAAQRQKEQAIVKVAGLQYLALRYAARFDHMQAKTMSACVGQLT